MKRLLALLAVLAGLAAASPAAADPPIWRIHSKQGAEIVLFGSVHLLKPGDAWETPQMLDALARAQSVWFEIPIDAQTRASAAGLVGQRALLPAGQRLSDKLSPKGRARLRRVAAMVGLPVAALDPMRPWFAEVTLTVMHLQSRGAASTAGVEETLAAKAPATAARKAFETEAEQIELLSGAALDEQLRSLMETLRQIEEEPAAFDALQAAWVKGDVAAIVREGVEPMRKITPAIYRQLVVERNRRWVVQIERLLKSPERAFIVVGVGHLVGPDSVPALLRRRGVVVEGP